MIFVLKIASSLGLSAATATASNGVNHNGGMKQQSIYTLEITFNGKAWMVRYVLNSLFTV
jgi:hypothetical protein